MYANPHHTLLHGGPLSSGTGAEKHSGDQPNTPKEPAGTNALSSNARALSAAAGRIVLLTTAQILIWNSAGHTVKVCALLESSFEATFVSECVAQSLHLRRDPVKVTVTGIQRAKTGAVTSSVRVIIGSEFVPTTDRDERICTLQTHESFAFQTTYEGSGRTCFTCP